MKKMIQFYSTLGIANTTFSFFSYNAFHTIWPSIILACMAIGCFIVAVMLKFVDRKMRRSFLQTLREYDDVEPGDKVAELLIDNIRSDIYDGKPLTMITHDIGFLHSRISRKKSVIGVDRRELDI
jgi:hypothetical protein